jgi:hypothetical protein
VEELRDRPGERVRTAELAPAGRIRAPSRWVVVDVVGHDQIHPAVPVVVEERGRRRPEPARDARGLAHVAEFAAALVAEEAEPAVLSQEHIEAAIVVHVADRHAHPSTRNGQTGSRARVAEAPVRLLMVEPVESAALGASILDEVEVKAAVAVVVE